MSRLNLTQKNNVKFGGFDKKIHSLKNKYSHKRTTPVKETELMIDEKIEENQELLLKTHEAGKHSKVGKFWKIATDVKAMDTFSLLVNLTICGVIMPITSYFLLYGGDKMLIKKGDIIGLGTKIFNHIKKDGKIGELFIALAKKHPTAVAYLSNDFLLNPLGKVLMRFHLFKGVANMLKHVHEKKEGLENSFLNLIGKCLFNYETMTAIHYALSHLTKGYEPDRITEITKGVKELPNAIKIMAKKSPGVVSSLPGNTKKFMGELPGNTKKFMSELPGNSKKFMSELPGTLKEQVISAVNVENMRNTLEKLKNIQTLSDISKSASVFLTIVDIILCGAKKSTWCSYLKPVQRFTLVFPIFLDLGETVYNVGVHLNKEYQGSSTRREFLKKLPISLIEGVIQETCYGKNKKIFKKKETTSDKTNEIQEYVDPDAAKALRKKGGKGRTLKNNTKGTGKPLKRLATEVKETTQKMADGAERIAKEVKDKLNTLDTESMASEVGKKVEDYTLTNY